MKSINNDISVRKQFRNKADVTGIHVCRNRFDLISLILAVSRTEVAFDRSSIFAF